LAICGVTALLRIVSPVTLIVIPHLQRHVDTVFIIGMMTKPSDRLESSGQPKFLVHSKEALNSTMLQNPLPQQELGFIVVSLKTGILVVVKINTLLIGKNHFLNQVDVSTGYQPSCHVNKVVICKDMRSLDVWLTHGFQAASFKPCLYRSCKTHYSLKKT
jgi:hypothetical protein